jgi:hypothetical protein
MERWWSVAAAVVLVGAALLTVAGPAGASGVSVRVTPNQGLVDGQTVTVTGRGLTPTRDGSPQTWFVTECTDAVSGRMNAAKDTPHCDVTAAKVVHVTKHGTFTARFQVVTGIIGDGYCGSDGYETCVIGVGTAQGQGSVARIGFKTTTG